MARQRLTDLLDKNAPDAAEKPAERKNTEGHKRGRDSLVNAFNTSTQSIKEVDPNECYVFEYNDREFSLLTQSDVQDLIDSFVDPAIGQLQPAIARKAPAGSSYKYEIIAGSRRLKASQWVVGNTSIKFKLKVVLHNFTEVEALRAMREENDYEKPSPYERAFATKRQIKNIFDDNLSKYCSAMNEKTSTVHDLLAFTQIPADLFEAYASKKDIPINHPVKIRTELGKNDDKPAFRISMIKAAKDLSKSEKQMSSADVLRQLLNAANEAIVKTKPKKAASTFLPVADDKKGIEVIKSKSGITTIRLNKACNANKAAAKKALESFIEKHFEA